MKKAYQLLIAALFISGCYVANAQSKWVTVTVAGTGVTGYNGDGIWGKSATIGAPYDVCVDVAQNIYFTDPGNGRVRKISARNGVITTVAGGGTSVVDGCLAVDAYLTPKNLCVDASGNIYVVSSAVNQIKRIDAVTNIITTVAGTGAAGFSGDGGAATAATFNGILGICTDAAGNIFLVDSGNSCIRKIAAGTGIVTTIAGNTTPGYSGDGGPATAAELHSPGNILVNPAGDILFMDQTGYTVFNARLRKISASTGIITTLAGGGSTVFGAPLMSTYLADVTGMCMDASGDIYCTEVSCSCRKLGLTTDLTYAVGGNFAIESYSDNVNSLVSYMNNPYGMAIDAAQNLYVADDFNNRIRKLVPVTNTPTFAYGNGVYLNSCAGSPVSIDSQLAITDLDSAQLETFTVIMLPAHGTVSGFPATTSAMGTFSIASPSGMSYTGSGTYTGVDSFMVQVSDGALKDTITIYLNNNYAGAIAGPDNICFAPESPVLYRSDISGGSWSVSNSNATVSSSGLVSTVVADTFTLIYTVSTTCGVVSTTKAIDIVSGLPPTAGVISGTGHVCPGSPITLTDGIGGGTWTVGNANATISSAGLLSGVSAGTDSVFYTVTNACGATTTGSLMTIVPIPSGGAITGTTNICKGETITLTDPTAVGPGVWSASNPYATISATGDVTALTVGRDIIYYTVTNSCGTAYTSTVVIITDCNNVGVAMTSSDPVITAFPNPASETLTIAWQDMDAANAQVSLTDVTGRVVFSGVLSGNGATSGTMGVSVSSLPDGVYLLHISSDSVHFTDKVVVTK